MCVIVAKKIQNSSSDIEPNWFLYKIRDKTYEPEYNVTYYKSREDLETVFITDISNDWSEGVNSSGIMLVNTTLQNHDDVNDGFNDVSDPMNRTNKKEGSILKEVFKTDNLEDAVNIVVDAKFEGCTFLSDGQKLYVLEIFLPKKVKDKYEKIILAENPDLDIEKAKTKKDYIEIRKQTRELVYKRVQDSDYSIVKKEIIEDDLVVRTNHGIYLKKAGYTPEDDGYDSSVNRRKVVIDTLESLEINNPFDVLTTIKNLDNEDIHKNPEMRPIRVDPSEYFTTTVLMLVPTGTMFAIPLRSSFKDIEIDKLLKPREVNFVLLPKNFNLWRIFESTKNNLKEYFNRRINNGKF